MNDHAQQDPQRVKANTARADLPENARHIPLANNFPIDDRDALPLAAAASSASLH